MRDANGYVGLVQGGGVSAWGVVRAIRCVCEEGNLISGAHISNQPITVQGV